MAQSVDFYLWFHADLDCLLLMQHILVQLSIGWNFESWLDFFSFLQFMLFCLLMDLIRVISRVCVLQTCKLDLDAWWNFMQNLSDITFIEKLEMKYVVRVNGMRDSHVPCSAGERCWVRVHGLSLRGFPAHGRWERVSASRTEGSRKSAALGSYSTSQGRSVSLKWESVWIWEVLLNVICVRSYS